MSQNNQYKPEVNYSNKTERRRQLVKKYLALGRTEHQIADKLDVARKTIQRDKEKLKEEIRESIDKEPIEDLLFDFDNQIETVKDEYWRTYQKANTDNAKIGALNNIRGLMKDKIKILQNLGIIREEPEKLEGDLNIDITEEIIPSDSDEDTHSDEEEE